MNETVPPAGLEAIETILYPVCKSDQCLGALSYLM
jgi:hypothetical protein